MKFQRAIATWRFEQVQPGEFLFQMLGTSRRGVHEAHVRRQDLLQNRDQQRIMGAGEHQRIDPLLHQRVQISLQNLPRRRVVDPVFLDQRNQQRSRLAVDQQAGFPQRERVLISVGTDRAASRDDADAFGIRAGERGFHARFDHPENGNPVFLMQTWQGVRGRGVAGDDDGFHPAGDKKPHVLVRELTDGLRAFRTIRQPGGVAEIQNVFRRQKFLHRPDDGQTTDTRVKKSKRR